MVHPALLSFILPAISAFVHPAPPPLSWMTFPLISMSTDLSYPALYATTPTPIHATIHYTSPSIPESASITPDTGAKYMRRINGLTAGTFIQRMRRINVDGPERIRTSRQSVYSAHLLCSCIWGDSQTVKTTRQTRWGAGGTQPYHVIKCAIFLPSITTGRNFEIHSSPGRNITGQYFRFNHATRLASICRRYERITYWRRHSNNVQMTQEDYTAVPLLGNVMIDGFHRLWLEADCRKSCPHYQCNYRQ